MISTQCIRNAVIPGPKGPPGVSGSDGEDGTNAFTTTVNAFNMPAGNGQAGVTVLSTEWMTVGQIVYVQTAGWMRVDAIPSPTTVNLTNLEVGGAYSENAAMGTVITGGSKVSPGGLQGPTGPSGRGALVEVPFLTPASVWTWIHNYGAYPQVEAFDTTHKQILASIEHVSLNRVDVKLASPYTGYIRGGT